jgi:hypothetical protein
MRIRMPPLLIVVLMGDRKHYDFLVQQAIAASSSADRHAGPSVIMEKRGFCQKSMREIEGELHYGRDEYRKWRLPDMTITTSSSHTLASNRTSVSRMI